MELLGNGRVRLNAEEAAEYQADPDGMMIKLRKWVDQQPRPEPKLDIEDQRRMAAALKLSWPQYQRGMRAAKKRGVTTKPPEEDADAVADGAAAGDLDH